MIPPIAVFDCVVYLQSCRPSPGARVALLREFPPQEKSLGVRPRISRHSPFGLSKISFGPSDSSF